MKIPGRHLEQFVRELSDACQVSQVDRINRGAWYKNYYELGAEDQGKAAIYNKTYAYIDDLESLLYSPVSLRFHIGDPDAPNVLDEAKGRAAATFLRNEARKSDTDSLISQAVCWSLVKGKSFIKQMWKRDSFSPKLVQPEAMGVLYESHDRLDEDMEAFTHSMLITPYQFERLIEHHPDRTVLQRKAKNYMRQSGSSLTDAGANKQVIVGQLYPYQVQGQPMSNARGIVNWMGSPTASLDPKVMSQMMRLDELWVWDDKREDWATFQIIGRDMLILGKYQIINSLAYDTATQSTHPALKGHHPFNEFCPSPEDEYFWGRSEIINVALLQEAINARIVGTNKLLRRQEDPSTKFVGATGVNQNALAKYRKPGGHWSDANPNAKIEDQVVNIPGDLWGSLHEYERMFDEMGGLPPIAKGHGESGVRSQGHAETLVRMFSPRFKDRALLIERSVEALGGLMLDLGRAHIDKRITAWVPKDQAGVEASDPTPLVPPPAPSLVPVHFQLADLDKDVTLSVDAHSSSPAFAMEAKALAFDLFKIGVMSKEQIVEHVDAPDPEGLIAGIERRDIAAAQAHQEEVAAKAAKSAKH